MERTHRKVDFFMGANTPDGFYSLYEELTLPRQGVRRYLVKGGAGTGKSSLMKAAADRFEKQDALVERIHCSSDPNSLDGVIFHTGQCSIVDATPPHVIEPSYPGGFESIVNLCDFFDEAKLEQRLERTVELQTANNACHKKCQSFLKCADLLLRENESIVAKSTDFQKIKMLANRIEKKEFRSGANAENGTEQRRLLSAVTNQGVLTYEQTVPALCDRVYLIRDDFGVTADALLGHLRKAALAKGYQIYTCGCPFSPQRKLEHLFLPKLRLGFVTRTPWCGFTELNGQVTVKTIHFTRFTDIKCLRLKKQYLSFHRKAAAELIHAAVDELKQAKNIHDDLELQYTDAVNFNGVNQTVMALFERMESRYSSR